MSAPKKTPAHGTPARYRLELKAGPGGKGGTPCDRCKSAHAKAAATARANRRANLKRGTLSIVPDIQDEHTPGDTPPAEDTSEADPPEPTPGPMEVAVTQDLSEITAEEQVPFHRTLSALALVLAKEADDAPTSAARSAATRQLFDVVKSLRVRKEGDGTTALDAFLGDFGSGPPALSGRSA